MIFEKREEREEGLYWWCLFEPGGGRGTLDIIQPVTEEVEGGACEVYTEDMHTLLSFTQT